MIEWSVEHSYYYTDIKVYNPANDKYALMAISPTMVKLLPSDIATWEYIIRVLTQRVS